MAHRRPPVALFEVIHKDKRFAKPSPQAMSTPAWYYKGEHHPAPSTVAGSATAVVDPPSKSTVTLRPTPPTASTLLGVPPTARLSDVADSSGDDSHAASDKTGDPAPSRLSRSAWSPSTITSLLRHDPLQAQPFDLGEAPLPAPRLPVPIHPSDYPAPAEEASVGSADQPAVDTSADLEVDTAPAVVTSEHEVSWPTMPTSPPFAPLDGGPRHERPTGALTFTSGSIIVISAAAVLAVGMFLTRPPRHAAGSSIPAPMTPPQAIDLGNGNSAGNQQPATPVQTPTPPLIVTPTAPIPVDAPATVERQHGLYYAMIQWYAEERTARAAAALLNRGGIPCTVEQHIHGIGSSFAVVGTQGFTRRSSAQTLAYFKKVEALSSTFAKNPHSLKAFRPRMFQWTQPGAAAPAAPGVG